MKYKILEDYIREDIRLHDGNPNYRLPSERVLMEKFGVSRQTVRRAYKQLSDDGVIVSKAGSGYYPVSTAEPSAVEVAVITTFVDDYIFPSLLRDMENVLCERGYRLKVYTTLNRVSAEREILTHLQGHNIAGIISEGCKTALPNPNMDLYANLRKAGVPIVFFQGHYPQLPQIPAVTDNNYAGGYKLARYLLDCGVRNIGGIFKSDDIQGPERYNGVMNAIKDAGLPLPDHSICWYDSTDRLKLVEGKNYSLIDTFYKEHLLYASSVICYNDEIAYHLIKYLNDNGKDVPSDLSVVSFDNSYYCRISPVPITSLGHTAKMGTEAARVLLSLIRGHKVHSKVLPWELYERKSAVTREKD